MPLGINIKQSNRSQQALDNLHQQQQHQQHQQNQHQLQHQLQLQHQQLQHQQLQQARASPTNSASASTSAITGSEDKAGYEARTNAQPQTYSTPRNDAQSYILPNSSQQGVDNRLYQDSIDQPSRSQSHRQSVTYPSIQSSSPTGDSRGGTVDDQALSDYRKYQNAGPISRPAPQQPVAEKKSKASRLFGGFSSKHSKSTEQSSQPPEQSSHNNLAGLGRRISVRQKEPPPLFQGQSQTHSNENHHQISGWHSGQSSESQLPSPREGGEDDNGVDPYLIHQPEQGQDRPQGHFHDQRQHPTIRIAQGDQDLLEIDESRGHNQYQQLPQILTQQQWQHSQSAVPVSPVITQQFEYQQQPMQQLGQYHQSPSNQTNIQFRPSQNPEVVSQLSHDSPVEQNEDQRPPSVQGNTQGQLPVGTYTSSQQPEYPTRINSFPVQRSLGQQPAMPPPQAQPQQGRRSVDVKQTLQPEPRNGPPPGYSPQQFTGPNQGPPSSSGNQLQTGPAPQLRGSALQREYTQGGPAEQGRSTPPLPVDRELTEMDKIVIKYKKVKGLYFEKLAQVEQLQNTLANQRLSQSRTSLDDSEYSSRFNRLDGAIKEIAFSIRKDWNTIPSWLGPYVNVDAQKVGAKEMTAVGRAAISRWIADGIFNKCFHPSLDPELSFELKKTEQNIRRVASPATSAEESEALISKVIQWKLTTIEGLSYHLNSAESIDHKARFTQTAVRDLTEHLLKHLLDSAPQGIEGNATSIVELAVSIACHLPLESRDISITYPLPCDSVLPTMKVEPALPPLENPQYLNPDESGSTNSEAKEDSGSIDGGKGEPNRLKKQDKNKLGPQGPGNGKKLSISAGSNETADGKTIKDRNREDGSQKIRFAGFMGVEVRGRQWLINPPVWTIS